MKRIFIGLLLCSASFGFADSDWKPLFDGKSFSGWSFDTRDKAAPDTIWNHERIDLRYFAGVIPIHLRNFLMK